MSRINCFDRAQYAAYDYSGGNARESTNTADTRRDTASSDDVSISAEARRRAFEEKTRIMMERSGVQFDESALRRMSQDFGFAMDSLGTLSPSGAFSRVLANSEADHEDMLRGLSEKYSELREGIRDAISALLGYVQPQSNSTSVSNSAEVNSASEALAATQANDAETEQTLEDFKREIYEIINRMPNHPTQDRSLMIIHISDKAFEKMMSDPGYKDETLYHIQQSMMGYDPVCPWYHIITIGDDCEYRADSYGAAFGSVFDSASTTGFTPNGGNKAASIAARKRAQVAFDRVTAQERLAEHRRREKELRDEEYEKELLARKHTATELQKEAAMKYERNILVIGL